MTASDFSYFTQFIPDLHVATLGELSTSDQGVRCLGTLSCASLKAVGFDKVKEDWYNERFFHKVRSCDALYRHGERSYLIEFKTGRPNNLDLHRKLYDSVMGLVEHSVLELETCRSTVQYLIVSNKYEPYPLHREMLAHFERGVKEPWDYDVTVTALNSWDDSDIRRLTGVLVEKIYKLSPADFEHFASSRYWHN